MKVNELIKTLTNYPPNKDVMMYTKDMLPEAVEKVIYNPNIDIVFINGAKE